eukprot:TRINITY_DN2097_c0_g1_i1.p1 TRINITY_DN2097_c0_g1~~TRINITY_DN2097_c0_g1_i1.p1  ORF type:complete len:1391 (-),score=307.26 TRINITY_DN2097_c0_g1_i1:3220-7392(-)
MSTPNIGDPWHANTTNSNAAASPTLIHPNTNTSTSAHISSMTETLQEEESLFTAAQTMRWDPIHVHLPPFPPTDQDPTMSTPHSGHELRKSHTQLLQLLAAYATHFEHRVQQLTPQHKQRHKSSFVVLNSDMLEVGDPLYARILRRLHETLHEVDSILTESLSTSSQRKVASEGILDHESLQSNQISRSNASQTLASRDTELWKSDTKQINGQKEVKDSGLDDLNSKDEESLRRRDSGTHPVVDEVQSVRSSSNSFAENYQSTEASPVKAKIQDIPSSPSKTAKVQFVATTSKPAQSPQRSSADVTASFDGGFVSSPVSTSVMSADLSFTSTISENSENQPQFNHEKEKQSHDDIVSPSNKANNRLSRQLEAPIPSWPTSHMGRMRSGTDATNPNLLSSSSMLAWMAVLEEENENPEDLAMGSNAAQNISAHDKMKSRSISTSVSTALAGLKGQSSSKAAIAERITTIFSHPPLGDSSAYSNRSRSSQTLSPVNPVVKGWLVRKEDRLIKSNKKYWAAVVGWKMYLFSSEQDPQVLDDFDLCHAFIQSLGRSEEDSRSFMLHTPFKSMQFSCPDSREKAEWVKALQGVIHEGKTLLDSSLSQRNSGLQRQGYLLVHRKESTTSSLDLRWCFAIESVFGYFRDPKNTKKIHLVDLSRAEILPNPHQSSESSLTLQYASEIYTLMAINTKEMDSWRTIIQYLMDSAKNSTREPEFWQGYLKKKSKGILSRSKDLWYVAKDDLLTAYKDLNILDVVAVYELDGASIRQVDKLTFELILQDGSVTALGGQSADNVIRCTQTLQLIINRIKAKQQGVIRKGMLNFKKTDTLRPGRREMKSYWFVLTKESLSYYKNRKDLKPKKSLGLLSMRLQTSENYQEECQFYIHLPNKVLQVVASDETAVTQWVEDLRTAINAAEMQARRKKRETMSLSNRQVALPANLLDPRRSSTPYGPGFQAEDPKASTAVKKVNANANVNDKDFEVEEDDRMSQGHENEADQDLKPRRYSLPTSLDYRGYRQAQYSPIVFDNGSSFLRIGYAREELPCSVFPSVAAYKNLENVSEYYIGYNAQRQQSVFGLPPVYPFCPGQDINWDAMVDMYSFAVYNELNIHARDYSFLLTHPAGMKPGDNEKMLEIMLEVFEVDGVHLQDPGPLPLFAVGESSGIVVNWGNRLTVTPVYEGCVLQDAQRKLDFGGKQLNSYMYYLLNKECGFRTAEKKAEMAAISIKEKFCYVALDYDKELADCKAGTKTLRQEVNFQRGVTGTIESQRFRVPEILFNPLLGGFEDDSVQSTIQKVVQACPIDVRREMCQNILLSGGTTITPGFRERLHKELQAITPALPPLQLRAEGLSKYLTWMGGAVLTLDDSFQDLVVRRESYEENGADRLVGELTDHPTEV